jgi:hypothetical protein
MYASDGGGVVEMPIKCVRTNVKSMDAMGRSLEIDFFAHVLNGYRLTGCGV